MSTRYLGDKGAAYFARQRRYGEVGARIDRFKFAPWVHPSDTIVDFGCGPGFMLDSLDAARKIGVEPNPSARRIVPSGIVVVASLSELDDSLADVVISNHVLEHVLQPYQELCEMRRVLRSDGRLVLWLPLERPRPIPASDPDNHLFAWTPLTLRNLLGEAGFELVQYRIVSHAWPPRFKWLHPTLPPRLFGLAAGATAVLRGRRQMFALAR